MSLFRPSYEKESDELLMSRIVRGDSKAFAELYDRHSPAMFRYFHRMLWKDRERAEDFTQDFFMKIVKTPDAFDVKRKFTTWMYSVAHNMCKNEYRRMEIRQGPDFEKAAYAVEGDHGEHFGKRIDRKAFMERLSGELDKLDENQRTTFLLRYEENFSIREISEILDCSEGTVKSRLFYTLKRLSTKLVEFAPEKNTVTES
ncbi:MAG TPA: sigma-70 family RNA polymerase sigma factor [Bacteroidia bacterium]|nr:sigma-70 family RNA polymerase sigma factor [Bacteroidia bacterium]